MICTVCIYICVRNFSLRKFRTFTVFAFFQFHGMEDFKAFLSSTGSAELVNFWLDCEYFKDSMEKFDEVATVEKRNRLFR